MVTRLVSFEVAMFMRHDFIPAALEHFLNETSVNWQAIVAMFAVAAAAAWLSWRAWRICRRALSGGSLTDCAHCPRSSETTKTTTLVQLGSGQIHRDEEPGEGSL